MNISHNDVVVRTFTTVVAVVNVKHLILWKHTTAERTKSTQSQQSLSAPLLLLLMLHAEYFAQTSYMAMIYYA